MGSTRPYHYSNSNRIKYSFGESNTVDGLWRSTHKYVAALLGLASAWDYWLKGKRNITLHPLNNASRYGHFPQYFNIFLVDLKPNTLYDISSQEEIPNDLKAVSTNLSPELVLQAYPMGLFPWHQDDKFFYWFSPDPRMVLFPEKVNVTKSMRNVLNQNKFSITENKAFEDVIEKCASIKRKDHGDTWITDDFKNTYVELHKMGFAKSIEAWNDKQELVGGLYGLEIGKIFFGESMFSSESNTSKTCFIYLAKKLESQGLSCLDCQAVNPHLKTLGAEEVSEAQFLELLEKSILS